MRSVGDALGLFAHRAHTYTKREGKMKILSIAVAFVGWSCWSGQVHAGSGYGSAIGGIETGERAIYEIGHPIPPTYEAASATQPNNTNFRQELLALVNIERIKANLTTVCMNSKLGTAAQRHASDMATKNYFSHTGWSGSSFSQRIAATGFRAGWAGEIIAAGQLDASAVMVSWMNSPGHRGIILGPNYKFVGAGYAYNKKTKWQHYWVQEFASSTSGACT